MCTLQKNIYIGETKRILKTRINEHLKHSTSAVFKHWRDMHADSNVHNIFSFSIVHNNIPHVHKRLVIESFYIKKFRASLMNGCEGTPTYLSGF